MVVLDNFASTTINQLPDEMIATIMEFADYSSVATCRQTNRRFNRIANRYRLFKLNAHYLRIQQPDSNTIELNFLDAHRDKPIEFYGDSYNRCFPHSLNEGQNITEILESYFSRMKSVKELCFKNIKIEEDIVNVLLKFKMVLRNVTLMVFEECVFNISKELMKRLVLATNLQQLNINSCYFQKQVVNDQVVGKLRLRVIPDSMSRTYLNLSDLTDEYLFRLVPQNIYSINLYGCQTGFTFPTVKYVIEKLVSTSECLLCWNFGFIKRKGCSDAEVQAFLESLNVEWRLNVSGGTKNYALEFPRTESECIYFDHYEFYEDIAFGFIDS